MDFKNTFGAIYRRAALISTTQFCLLFCGVSLIIAAMLMPKQPYQRFVPFPGIDSIPAFALDTKTGQECVIKGSTREDVVKQTKEMGIPFCIDLYKERK